MKVWSRGSLLKKVLRTPGLDSIHCTSILLVVISIIIFCHNLC